MENMWLNFDYNIASNQMENMRTLIRTRGGNRAGRAGPKSGRIKIDPIFSDQDFNSPTRPKNLTDQAK